MKSKVFALSIAAVMSVSGLAFAEEMAAQEAAAVAPVVEQAAPQQAEAAVVPGFTIVGNKICPVSGKAIGTEGMTPNTVEYNGKLYNLCCPDCKAQFLADPEKFSKIAEAEVAATAQAVQLTNEGQVKSPVTGEPMADMPSMK